MPDTTSLQYVTAFFDSRSEAESAVERLTSDGIPRSEIQMIEGNEAPGTATGSAGEDKGFLASLADLFLPREDHHSYAEGLNRGGYLVSVGVTSENHRQVLDILDDQGAVNMDEREESWHAEGWSGHQPDSATTGAAAPRGDTEQVDGTIDVMEENVRVGKRQVEQGHVRVRSHVVETPVEEQVSLRDETIHVTRTPVDRVVTDGDDVFADRTLEATEVDEEAVVSKETRITEEITLDKDAEDRTETVRDKVRHTEVEVEDERTGRKD